MSDEPTDLRRSPGTALRQLRESKGLTLDAVAEATHVKIRYLVALEQEDFGALLGPAYAKSFLKAYAHFVDADPSLVDEYREAMSACATPAPSALPAPSRGGRALWVVGACAVVAILTVALVPRRPPPTAESQAAAPVDSGVSDFDGLVPSADSIVPPAGQPMLPADTMAALQILAIDSTWVEVSSDGELRLHELLMPGDARIVDAASEYRLTLGNAGGVELALNGERLPPPGPRGMVIRNMIIPAQRAPSQP